MEFGFKSLPFKRNVRRHCAVVRGSWVVLCVSSSHRGGCRCASRRYTRSPARRVCASRTACSASARSTGTRRTRRSERRRSAVS